MVSETTTTTASEGTVDKTATEAPSLEELHRQAEARISSYSYARPGDFGTSKGQVRLGRANSVVAEVQLLKKGGGENNLHYHSNGDSFWMVLKGRVRFYGAGDRVIGDYGPQEGLITPRFCRYWFENVADTDTELLHISALANPRNPRSGRQSLAPRPQYQIDQEQFDATKK